MEDEPTDPQPVSLGDGRFFLTIGYGAGCAMIKVAKPPAAIGASARSLKTRVAAAKSRPPCSTTVYLHNSDDNKRGLQCLDLDGNVKWETGSKPEFGLGSMIIVDGVIFIISDSTGELVMAEANRSNTRRLVAPKCWAVRTSGRRWPSATACSSFAIRAR
jgi:hypothetical protein